MNAWGTTQATDRRRSDGERIHDPARQSGQVDVATRIADLNAQWLTFAVDEADPRKADSAPSSGRKPTGQVR